MRHYELMVILDPELEERTVAPALDQFLNVVRKDGGTVEKVDVWGRRRLTYEIAKKTEGIYAVIDLHGRARRPSRSSTASSTSTRPCCAPRSCARPALATVRHPQAGTRHGRRHRHHRRRQPHRRPRAALHPERGGRRELHASPPPRASSTSRPTSGRTATALFLRCNVWRQAAENVAESLQRGMRVIVQGRLKQRSYETKEGEKRTVFELEVDEVGPPLRNATAKVTKIAAVAAAAASAAAAAAAGGRRRPVGLGALRRPSPGGRQRRSAAGGWSAAGAVRRAAVLIHRRPPARPAGRATDDIRSTIPATTPGIQ